MRPEHKRLLNVRSLRGTANENAEPAIALTDLLIGFMHGSNDSGCVDQNGKVLTDKRQDALAHHVFGKPYRTVLRYRKMSLYDGEFDILKCMRIDIA